MSVWFEGSIEIDCSIQQVKHSLDDTGELFVGVTSLMPGLNSVELVEQDTDVVIIRTNEGLMTRTKITKHIEVDRVVLEFDEEYQAGSLVTAKSHTMSQFTTGDAGVRNSIVISRVEAPGLLGFFYRTFGGSRIGRALLNSNKLFFERQNP